jgi:hypothetical protein
VAAAQHEATGERCWRDVGDVPRSRLTLQGIGLTMSESNPPRVLGDKVWCPRCGDYVKFVRVSGAAKIVDVDRRTVYNYVKQNKVYGVKVAGSTLRVCSHCLLRPQ